MITADATSETHSVSVAATGAILAAASAASTSTATAAAIDGGDGNDVISNDHALVSKAKSSAGGVSVSVALAGGAVSGSPFDNATQANATANGIVGGTGDDRVYNTELSLITLDSLAIAKDTAVSVGVIGFSGTNSGSKATARATGIDGGDGNDVLDNQGAITGTVTAEGKSHGISVTLTGVSIDDASTTADAGVTGIDGGAGDDSIINAGAITLTPHAEATGSSVGVSVSGLSVAIGDASANATSGATGIDGGQGNNDIVNRGVITETVTANGTARNIGVGLGIGSTLSKADTTVTAAAAGIRGGDDSDNVSNENTIDVTAASVATADSVSVIASGVSHASARTLPGSTAVGIDGGAGNDVIANTGHVLVAATSDGTVKNSSWSVAGVSGSDSGTIATATATGLSGGDGDDLIENLADLGVTAGSNVTQNGSSFAFGGVGGAGGTLTATGTATGIAGGEGADVVRNEGAISVGVTSSLSSSGGSITPFGTSQATTTVGADAAATGIDAGAGDDSITNLDTIDVTASSSVTQTNTSFTFGGTGATGGRSRRRPVPRVSTVAMDRTTSTAKTRLP